MFFPDLNFIQEVITNLMYDTFFRLHIRALP